MPFGCLDYLTLLGTCVQQQGRKAAASPSQIVRLHHVKIFRISRGQSCSHVEGMRQLKCARQPTVKGGTVQGRMTNDGSIAMDEPRTTSYRARQARIMSSYCCRSKAMEHVGDQSADVFELVFDECRNLGPIFENEAPLDLESCEHVPQIADKARIIMPGASGQTGWVSRYEHVLFTTSTYREGQCGHSAGIHGVASTQDSRHARHAIDHPLSIWSIVR